MKAFFDRYSYECVRLLLNQVAISMFGFALAMSAVKAESDPLLLWSSIAAIVFYLALTYGTAWKVGSGDRLSIQYGKIPYRPFRGLVLSLIANSINLLLALFITLGVFCRVPVLEDIPSTIALLSQGMYMGLLTVVKIGEVSLHDVWWVFFLLPVPAMLTSLVAYIAGAKDVHITKMGIPELPESDRPTRQELREQKELEKKGKK